MLKNNHRHKWSVASDTRHLVKQISEDVPYQKQLLFHWACKWLFLQVLVHQGRTPAKQAGKKTGMVVHMHHNWWFISGSVSNCATSVLLAIVAFLFAQVVVKYGLGKRISLYIVSA